MDSIFFEKQFSRLCAQHALNMLLQGPYFTAADLADLAGELDQRERAVLGIPAMDFQSQNCDDSGFFSIQVITLALQRLSPHLRLVPFESPDAIEYKTQPELAKAYILNLAEHWFVLRRFNQHWFILNSLLKGPHYITASYLTLYLAQLAAEGYSILVVAGELPECPADHIRYVTPKQTSAANDDIAKAIKMSLDEHSIPSSAKPFLTKANAKSEEANLKEAIEQSLKSDGQKEEEGELERAIRMSLEESQLSAAHSLPRFAQGGPLESIRPEESIEHNSQENTESESREEELEEFLFIAMAEEVGLQGPHLGTAAEIETPSQGPVSPVPETRLGEAVDALIVAWNQLFAQIVTDVGHVQPTVDHIKENVEYSVRQFKDACLEVSGEFGRVSLERRLSHPCEELQEELSDLETAIHRQRLLLSGLEGKTLERT